MRERAHVASKKRNIFSFEVKKGKEKDAKILQVMATYAAQLSASVFDGKRVEIHLCDKRLKTLKVVEAAR